MHTRPDPAAPDPDPDPIAWAKVVQTEGLVRARHPPGRFDELPRAEQRRRVGLALLSLREPDLAAALLAAATDPEGPLILPPDRSLPVDKFGQAIADADRRPLTCPAHPGALLRDRILPASGLSTAECARRLGLSRQALHKVLTARSALTADLAARLGRVFGIDPSPLLRLQAARDLWFAERTLDQTTVEPIPS